MACWMTEYINHCVFMGQKYRLVWTAGFSGSSLPTCQSEMDDPSYWKPWNQKLGFGQGQCSSLLAIHPQVECKDGWSRREWWVHGLAESLLRVHETKRRMGIARPGRRCCSGKECWSWPLPPLYSALELNAGLARISCWDLDLSYSKTHTLCRNL